MANSLRGEVSFSTPEKETMTMVWDYDTFVILEDHLDLGIMPIMKRVEAGRLGAIRGAFWAGLQQNHPEVTVAQATAIMLACGGTEWATKLVTECIQKSLPPKEEAAEGSGDPPPAGSSDGPKEPEKVD